LQDEFESKKAKKQIPFRVTDTEDEYLRLITDKAGLKSSSNLIRRGIRKMAEELGMDLPDDVFSDKPGGNWLPKPVALMTINQQSDGNNTAVGTGIPIAALS